MGVICCCCHHYGNPDERVPLMTTKSNNNPLFINNEKGSLVDKIVQKATETDSLNIDPVIKEIIDQMSSDDKDDFDEEKYKTILQNIEDQFSELI